MFFRLIVLFGLISAVLGSVMVKSYYNGEPLGDGDGNAEYHCFELDGKGRPSYVRGTYSNRGYFEGAVNRGIATVNFYEISIVNGELVPTTGAAYLSYTNNWSMVRGSFWNGGGGNISTPEEWGIVGENKNMGGLTQKAVIEEKCLWARSADMSPNVPVIVNGVLFGSPTSVNTFRNTVVGSMDSFGGTTGAYVYVYSDEECMELEIDCVGRGNTEFGGYGLHAVSANLRSSKIFVSTWNAVTGPYAGEVGSGIYSVYQTKGMLKVKGLFCYKIVSEEPRQNPDKPPKIVTYLGGCAPDSAPSIEEAMDGITASTMMRNFGDSMEVNALIEFATSLVGSP